MIDIRRKINHHPQKGMLGNYETPRGIGGGFNMRRVRGQVFILILASMMVCFGETTLGRGLIDEHTLAYWKFDEGSGKTAGDSSENGNTGEIENAKWTDGISGTALFFDGKSSRVVVPDSDSLHPETGDITIEAWIKVASDPKGWGPGASGAGAIVFKQNAYQWNVHGELNGTLWFGIWGARLESTDAYLFSEHIDEWHHTALTFEGKSQEAKIYVDGKLVKEGTVAESVDRSTAPLYIGYKGDDNVYFHGTIDEVRISDVVRTKEEIQNMIKLSLAVYSAGKLPVLWGRLKSSQLW